MHEQLLRRIYQARRDKACRIAALMIAAVLAERQVPHGCAAQTEALGNAAPGLVLMAGDAADPACAGTQSLRVHLVR